MRGNVLQNSTWLLGLSRCFELWSGNGALHREHLTTYLLLTGPLRCTGDCSRWRRTAEELDEAPQVLCGGGQEHLIFSPAQAAQPQPVELKDALHVRKPHLDLFALSTRLFVSFGLGQSAGDIAGILVQIARNLPRRHVGAALHFEGAGIAIEL